MTMIVAVHATSCTTSQPHAYVNIVTREMAAALGLPSSVLGLALGKVEEHDRLGIAGSQ